MTLVIDQSAGEEGSKGKQVYAHNLCGEMKMRAEHPGRLTATSKPYQAHTAVLSLFILLYRIVGRHASRLYGVL